MKDVQAITLDLDDTLWPVWPVIRAADATLWRHIGEHHPAVAQRYDATSLVDVRNSVAAARPELVHDLTRLREATLARAFEHADEDVNGVDAAMEIFLQARNAVTFFPDALEGLRRIAERLPIVAVSNGNADVERIGIGDLFAGTMSAIEAGCAKPDPRIFHQACELAGVEPGRTLHVGDHQEQDVVGAAEAGLRTAWINREEHEWTQSRTPDVVAVDMLDLAGRLLD